MARYEFPTTAELLELGAPRENAVTVYAPATAAEFELARTTVKSSFDEAIRILRENGANHALETAFHERIAQVMADECWHKLSRSLAIFATPETVEVFVLPNNLESQLQVGKYFDLGQFVRAVATPQDAYALTLSGNQWNLWRASASARAHEFEADKEGHDSVTHREEDMPDVLDEYAKHVAVITERELNREDPSGQRPLFLFAADPLEGIFRQIGVGPREIVRNVGSPDELKPDEVDAAIRGGLDQINAERASTTVNILADGVSKGWSPPISLISRAPQSVAPSIPSSTSSPSTFWVVWTMRPARSRTSTMGTTCCRGSRSSFSRTAARWFRSAMPMSPPIFGTASPSHVCAIRWRSDRLTRTLSGPTTARLWGPTANLGVCAT